MVSITRFLEITVSSSKMISYYSVDQVHCYSNHYKLRSPFCWMNWNTWMVIAFCLDNFLNLKLFGEAWTFGINLQIYWWRIEEQNFWSQLGIKWHFWSRVLWVCHPFCIFFWNFSSMHDLNLQWDSFYNTFSFNPNSRNKQFIWSWWVWQLAFMMLVSSTTIY